MSSVYLPVVTEFQPSSAYVYSLNIHKQLIKDMETLGKEGGFATLSQFYTFSDEQSKDEVFQFVKDHRFVLEVLIEAPKHIFSIFGRDVLLDLELSRDYKEDFECLFITIRTSLSPEDSLNLLDRLDAEWWLDIEDDISNILEVMVRPA